MDGIKAIVKCGKRKKYGGPLTEPYTTGHHSELSVNLTSKVSDESNSSTTRGHKPLVIKDKGLNEEIGVDVLDQLVDVKALKINISQLPPKTRGLLSQMVRTPQNELRALTMSYFQMNKIDLKCLQIFLRMEKKNNVFQKYRDSPFPVIGKTLVEKLCLLLIVFRFDKQLGKSLMDELLMGSVQIDPKGNVEAKKQLRLSASVKAMLCEAFSKNRLPTADQYDMITCRIWQQGHEIRREQVAMWFRNKRNYCRPNRKIAKRSEDIPPEGDGENQKEIPGRSEEEKVQGKQLCPATPSAAAREDKTGSAAISQENNLQNTLPSAKGRTSVSKNHEDDKKAKNAACSNCSLCSKTYRYPSSLKYHQRAVHGDLKPYICSTCGKDYVTSGQLKIHERKTHGQEGPLGFQGYQCNICDKRFHGMHNLRSHMMTHSELRSFTCDICHKAFKARHKLTAHLKIHSDRRDYQCEICQEKFKQVETLISHKKKHSEQQFGCKLCSKKFTSTSGLRDHQVVHEEKRAFKCTHCDKAYLYRTNLRRHRSSVHGDVEKRYKCEECDIAFRLKDYYSMHRRRYHGEGKPPPDYIRMRKMRRPAKSLKPEIAPDVVSHATRMPKHVNTSPVFQNQPTEAGAGQVLTPNVLAQTTPADSCTPPRQHVHAESCGIQGTVNTTEASAVEASALISPLQGKPADSLITAGKQVLPKGIHLIQPKLQNVHGEQSHLLESQDTIKTEDIKPDIDALESTYSSMDSMFEETTIFISNSVDTDNVKVENGFENCSLIVSSITQGQNLNFSDSQDDTKDEFTLCQFADGTSERCLVDSAQHGYDQRIPPLVITPSRDTVSPLAVSTPKWVGHRSTESK